ncbi:hypothetical protein JCM6882_007708 [Rhodosporidiobolus microsporus]
MTAPSLDHSTSTCGGGQGGRDNGDEGAGDVTTSSVVGQLGEDVEARRKEEGTATTSPFDRLPDEVIHLILDFATRSDGTLLPFSDFSLNQRIARIAKPLWLSDPVRDEGQQVGFFEHLIQHPQLAHHVFEFTNWLSEDFRAYRYEFTLMRQLVNLTTLTIQMKSDDHTGLWCFPTAATHMLRFLPRLLDLRLFFETRWMAGDETFRIATSLPHLRRLSITSTGAGDARQFLTPPPPNLEHLELDVDAPDGVYAQIPWATLSSLSIALPLDAPAEHLVVLSHGLEQAAEAVKPACLPLRCFELQNIVLEKKPALAPDTRPIETLVLLQAIRLMSVVSLSLAVSCNIDMPDSPPLPSVEVLDVDAELCILGKLDNFEALITLLQLFPSLTHLRLRSFLAHDLTRPFAASHSRPSHPDYLNLHPPLEDLTLFLVKTAVKVFEWRPAGGRHWIKFWREHSGRGTFEMETFATEP